VQSFDPDRSITLQHPGGIELLVPGGSFHCDGENFAKHAWLRLPMAHAVDLKTSAKVPGSGKKPAICAMSNNRIKKSRATSVANSTQLTSPLYG